MLTAILWGIGCFCIIVLVCTVAVLVKKNKEKKDSGQTVTSVTVTASPGQATDSTPPSPKPPRDWAKHREEARKWIKPIFQIAMIVAVIVLIKRGIPAFETYVNKDWNRPILATDGLRLQPMTTIYVSDFGSQKVTILPNRPVMVTFDPDFSDRMKGKMGIHWEVVENDDQGCVYFNHSQEVCPGQRLPRSGVSQMFFETRGGPKTLVIDIYDMKPAKDTVLTDTLPAPSKAPAIKQFQGAAD